MLLPWPLTRLFNALFEMLMNRNPALGVSLGGIVGVSAVGMFGEGIVVGGTFPVTQILGLIVGSIAWMPGYR